MWTQDNLDILRGLNSESIDLVYADPPFSSNKNYAAPIGSKAAGAAFKDTSARLPDNLRRSLRHRWRSSCGRSTPKGCGTPGPGSTG